MRSIIFLLPALTLLACGEKEGDSGEASDDTAAADDSGGGTDDSSATDDSAATDDSGTEAFSCGEVPEPPEPTVAAVRIESSVTWSLEFSEEAQANDYFNCSYTRDYEGLQELNLEYLCPDCEVITSGTATMVDGEDCFAQISSAGPVRTEMWGVTEDGRLFRTGSYQRVLGELDTFEAENGEAEIGWDSVSDLTSGGTMTLTATGTMRWWDDPETLIVDDSQPRTTPYAAGWEQNDPGDLVSTFPPALGETFPNVRLMDQCGDPVDLWDFHGSYLVLDSSQHDCGPCIAMAQGEHDFLEAIRAEGYDVRVITMMGNGLSDPTGTPSEDIVNDWVEAHSMIEPVLYDRGFAYATFPDFILEYSGESFGFPAWLVVDPEMNLIHGNVGFSSWDAVAEIIRADAEGQ